MAQRILIWNRFHAAWTIHPLETERLSRVASSTGQVRAIAAAVLESAPLPMPADGAWEVVGLRGWSGVA